jgi:hypothetical protein
MLLLKQNGNTITGTYESGQGTLSGNVLQVKWSNSASDKQGTLRFVFDGDFSNFNGTWGYNNEPKTRNWSGH